MADGWTYLTNSPKWHYFGEDGHSLCGKWMTFTKDRENENHDSPDNCKACRKKLKFSYGEEVTQ